MKDSQTQPLNGNSKSNKGNVSDYDAQMAALNAQIAMNQYLMMKQMEYIQQKNKTKKDKKNKNLSEMQQLMMDQMQVIDTAHDNIHK